MHCQGVHASDLQLHYRYHQNRELYQWASWRRMEEGRDLISENRREALLYARQGRVPRCAATRHDRELSHRLRRRGNCAAEHEQIINLRIGTSADTYSVGRITWKASAPQNGE